MRNLILLFLMTFSVATFAKKDSCQDIQEKAKAALRQPAKVYENMATYFQKSQYGKKLKNITIRKRGNCIDGQTLYQFSQKTSSFEKVKKNFHFHLDPLHKDHFEVYDAKGNFRHVANFDGTINQNKTDQVFRGKTKARNVFKCL